MEAANLWKRSGKCLFVGEGNLSFSLSMVEKGCVDASSTTTSIFERFKDCKEEVIENAERLRDLGAQVLEAVDARYVASRFSGKRFQTVIFQFPNVASRDPKFGHNPNRLLLRKFLRSCRELLLSSGGVMITTVDSPHYEGAFQFEDSARETGYDVIEKARFFKKDFPGYCHQNTDDEDNSALSNHRRYVTHVFAKRQVS